MLLYYRRIVDRIGVGGGHWRQSCSDVVGGARRGEPTRKIRTTNESSLPPPPELIYRNHRPRIYIQGDEEEQDDDDDGEEQEEEINIGRLLDILCAHGAYKSFLVSGPSRAQYYYYYYLLAESLVAEHSRRCAAISDNIIRVGTCADLTHTRLRTRRYSYVYNIVRTHTGDACGGSAGVRYTSISERDGARGGPPRGSNAATDSAHSGPGK